MLYIENLLLLAGNILTPVYYLIVLITLIFYYPYII